MWVSTSGTFHSGEQGIIFRNWLLGCCMMLRHGWLYRDFLSLGQFREYVFFRCPFVLRLALKAHGGGVPVILPSLHRIRVFLHPFFCYAHKGSKCSTAVFQFIQYGQPVFRTLLFANADRQYRFPAFGIDAQNHIGRQSDTPPVSRWAHIPKRPREPTKPDSHGSLGLRNRLLFINYFCVKWFLPSWLLPN